MTEKQTREQMATAAGEQFENLTSSASTFAEADKQFRYCRLGLREEPQRVIFPKVARSMAEVETGLRDIMRLLAMGKAKWPLLLIGKAGSGKTSAALALSDFCRKPCFYSVADACRCVMADRSEGLAEKLDSDMKDMQLFILDELAERDKVTDLEYSTVKRVLDVRERLNGPLVVMANHTLETLGSQYDVRIHSRLQAGTVYVMESGDRRIGVK